MSDPNAPRPEGGDEREQFSVTDEQHAPQSPPDTDGGRDLTAPDGPGVGRLAQPFSQGEAPGRPAFDGAGSSAPRDDQPGQQGQGYGQAQYGQGQYGQPQGQYEQPQGQYGQSSSAQSPYGQGQYAAPGGPQGQQHGQPGASQYGAGQYGAPGQPQYAQGAPMSPVDEKNAGMWGHLSGLSTIVTAGWGGWIGPLIVFLMYKDRSAFARQESKEALNFGILMTIILAAMYVIGTVLSFVGIGVLLFFFVWVPPLLQVIFSIIGGVQVNNGGSYRYPFNWRLVK